MRLQPALNSNKFGTRDKTMSHITECTTAVKPIQKFILIKETQSRYQHWQAIYTLYRLTGRLDYLQKQKTTQRVDTISVHWAHERSCTEIGKVCWHEKTVFKYLYNKINPRYFRNVGIPKCISEHCKRNLVRQAVQCYHAPSAIKKTLKLANIVRTTQKVLHENKNLK